MNLNGLTTINIELTSRCNKLCHICGRRLKDKELSSKNMNPVQYGDIEFSLLEIISFQVPNDLVIALHNNGEPLMYPFLKEAIELFKKRKCITNLVTNGKLLIKKFDDIVDNLDTISISVFENDVEQEDQYKIIEEFITKKGDRKPFTTLRLIGNISDEKYKKFGCLIIRRLLHSPKGSFDYISNQVKRQPTIPETGICQDFLHHLAIDRFGDVSCCVRFDPNKELVLGNIKNQTLVELWNCEKRLRMKEKHILGKRSQIEFCNKCEFYGIPTGE